MPVLGPIVDAVEALNAQIRRYDRALEKRVKARYLQDGQLLQQIRGVGPTAALYSLLVIGNPERFASATKVCGYLGFG